MSTTTPSTPEPVEYDSPDGRTPVNHYMRGGVECIDVMRAITTPAQFQAHCHLTAFKYLYRLGEKDDPAREVKKARDYLMWMQQSLEEEAKNKARSPYQKIGAALRDHKPNDPNYPKNPPAIVGSESHNPGGLY